MGKHHEHRNPDDRSHHAADGERHRMKFKTHRMGASWQIHLPQAVVFAQQLLRLPIDKKTPVSVQAILEHLYPRAK